MLDIFSTIGEIYMADYSFDTDLDTKLITLT